MSLKEQVADMRRWALSRIDWCRRAEAKFGSGDVAIEAAVERRALTAVLEQLGFTVPGVTDEQVREWSRTSPWPASTDRKPLTRSAEQASGDAGAGRRGE